MATFTISVNSKVNQVPSQVGNLNLILDYNDVYVFTLADFTTNTVPPYADPEGDALLKIQIVGTVPTIGTLLLNGVPVNISDEITNAQIIAGQLTYQADAGTTTAYLDTFSFSAADTGSGNYNLSVFGTVSLNVEAEVNQPPTEVGDGSETIDYGQTLVFTRAMFTTNTVPPYSDPEGDAALNLKITGLPVAGNIKLNNVNVVVNQIIPFTSIDSGLLTYVPDLTDTDGDLESFTFEIADAGSGIFVA